MRVYNAIIRVRWCMWLNERIPKENIEASEMDALEKLIENRS